MEKVRERLLRAVRAREDARIPYAVVGGNAVAAWVARVDESVARKNTQDVDLALRRDDVEAAKRAMAASGLSIDTSRESTCSWTGPMPGQGCGPRRLRRRKVRSDYVLPVLEVSHAEPEKGVRLMSLESLVRMKLTSFRRKDQVHLLDLIGVDLVDETWLDRLPPPLAPRLKELLVDPDG